MQRAVLWAPEIEQAFVWGWLSCGSPASVLEALRQSQHSLSNCWMAAANPDGSFWEHTHPVGMGTPYAAHEAVGTATFLGSEHSATGADIRVLGSCLSVGRLASLLIVSAFAPSLGFW